MRPRGTLTLGAGDHPGTDLFERRVLFSLGLLLLGCGPPAISALGSSGGKAAARGSRTPDLLITNQLLYLLSYSGIQCGTTPPAQTPANMNRSPSGSRLRRRASGAPQLPATCGGGGRQAFVDSSGMDFDGNRRPSRPSSSGPYRHSVILSWMGPGRSAPAPDEQSGPGRGPGPR